MKIIAAFMFALLAYYFAYDKLLKFVRSAHWDSLNAASLCFGFPLAKHYALGLNA